MKIAVAQINTDDRVEANLDKVEKFAQQAALGGASAVVFPEATMAAFGTSLIQACIDFGEHWRMAMSALAQQTGLNIIVGEFEQAGRRVRNLAALYRPDRSRTAYAKIHTYDAFGYRESETVEAGDSMLTVEIDTVTVGFAICYDIRFPKLFAELSRSGAQLIIVPTSWGAGSGKLEQWEVLTRARALDSNSTIVAVDQADPSVSGVQAVESAPTGIGHSIVVDPFGHVIIELGRGEELHTVDIDPSRNKLAQKNIPVLANAKLNY
jgi:predicted amidohydrolase